MASEDIQLMAHLMRRAGFGASYDELEARAAKGYEATVEELLSPESQPELEMDLLERYHIDWKEMNVLEVNQAYLTFRMINTQRPLHEKVALFWHGILCTGNSKCEHGRQIQIQLDMFRRLGMGSFPALLWGLSKDPAMVFYLDNCMSHKDAINENYGACPMKLGREVSRHNELANWRNTHRFESVMATKWLLLTISETEPGLWDRLYGRELLELFSLGVGMDGQANYSEEDVKECARAFTGWTITNAIPRYPYGRYESEFVYNPDDHDDSEKTFLGETGRWNGEDVINIIARQPAAARFVSRHLYNFFVADEPQVPAWQDTPPRDPAAIKILEDEYFRSNYDLRSMLRVLFNSDFFKKARFSKVKSPTEAVINTMRLVGDFKTPKPGLHEIAMEIRYMGQDLMNPPTVEGWHTGREWIDSGTLVERINFAADQVGNTNLPGVRSIINRLASQGATLSPEQLVDGCLEMLGAYQLPEETHSQLVDHARNGGELQCGTEDFNTRVGQMLQLMVSTQEYQFA